MKITLYENKSALKYNPNTAKNVGVGEIETCLIGLSREFAKRGHDVTCFVNCNTPDLYDGVKFYDVSSYEPADVDLFIGLESFPAEIRAAKVVNWVHRNTVESARFTEVDKTVFVSEWQRDYFRELGLSQEILSKAEIISNGINLEIFDQSAPKEESSLVYAAFPTKGMVHLSEIFPRIKERVPKAKLHVYGGAGLWGWNNEQFRPMYNKMIRAGILFHGRTGSEHLARRLNEHKIYLYPCTFFETFCSPVLEAMAAGCVPITTGIGNLPNIVENAKNGYIIEGSPKDFMWQHAAVDKVVKLLTNERLFNKLSEEARRIAHKYTWEKAAQQFENLEQKYT